jgi:adenylate cyclase
VQPPDSGDSIPATEVLQQLERLLVHEKLAQSPRISRFLRFVVECKLDGNGESLKEFAIGTHVFDRGTDFDPRTDPIVRVQAANLRAKLDEYYSGHGAGDPIVITVPKGSYVPTFTRPGEIPSATPVDGLRETVAVLPFVNLSSDPENDYFSDGLTEEIISCLAAVRGLKVVARTSVFRFKGQSHDIRDVGKQLHVGTALEGSVRRSGQQVRITAQLIDTKSGLHLWSATFQRELGDIFAVQEEIAGAVAAALLPHFSPQPSKRREPSVQAHDLYLRGRFAQNQILEGSTERAVIFFEQAIAADPLYARAYAGLADFWFSLALWGVARPHDVIPKSKAAALRALELDDQLAEAHVVLGLILCSYDFEWEQGRRSIETALRLDENLAAGYEAMAIYVLVPLGRLTDAIAVLKKASALDPFRHIPQFALTACYTLLSDFDAAERQYKALPDPSPYASLVMAAAYEEHGLLDRAIAELESVRASSPDMYSVPVELCRMYTAKGWPEKAQRELDAVVDSVAKRYVPAVEVAVAYWGVRNREEALNWLRKAAEERTTRLWTLPSCCLRFAGLIEEPEFHEVLYSIGLKPVANC